MNRQKTVSKVLELKEFAQEQIETEVRKAKDELDTEQARLTSIEEALKNTLAQIDSEDRNCSAMIQGRDFFYSYMMHLNREIERQTRVVLKKTQELETKKNAMVEAYKEKRLIETLHDRILSKKMRESSLSEQKEADSNFISREMRR